MTLELMAKVTLILFAAALGALLLRRSSAAARHVVQVGGLIAVLALPLMVLALPVWELPLLAPVESSSGDGAELESTTSDELAGMLGGANGELPVVLGPYVEGGPDCPCPLAGPRGNHDENQLDDRTIAGLAGGPGSQGPPIDFLALVLSVVPWLWALGAAFVLGRLAIGWLRITRVAIDARPLECARSWHMIHHCRQKLGIRVVPRVLLSRDVKVPVLWGFFKPTLLLPSSASAWPAARLRVVLLHELAHLRRLDGLALLIGRLSAAAWWFHPLVWFVERRARRDCERACDDIVLASGERPSSYAAHLLDIAGELPGALPAPAGALAILGPGRLEVRVKSILHPGLRRGLSRRGAVALLSIFLIGLVSIASGKLGMRAAEPQQEPSPDVMVGVETSPESDVLVGTKAQPRPDDVMLVDGKGNPEGERAFKKAYELHKQERFEEAAAAFLEAADVGFRPGTARYNAACCYARLGLTADAVHLIEQAFEEDFDNYDLLMKDSDLDPIRREPAFQQMMEQMRDQGRLHGDSGDRYQVAMEMYEELGDESSTNGKAWYKVGSALLGFREYDRGIDALDRAVEHLGDGNSGALYNLACAYSLKGEARPALDYLERAVLAGFDSEERFRNDSDLDNIRDNERFADISALHDTLSLDRYRDKKDWSGSDYSAQRWAPAVEELTEFTERNPDVGRGWYGLGLALHYSGRYAEALEAFQKQLDLGYKTSVATYNIACAYAMNNDADAALTWLGRAVDTGDFGSKQIRHDKDLKTLHEDPRFEELIERAAENDKDHEIRFKFEKEFYWQEREKQKQKKQEAASIS